MGITTVPAFVPVDVSTRLAALESANALATFVANAKAVLSGGGPLLVDSGYNVKWPQRFLVMGAGRSASICPDGSFSIDMPPVGTVIPRVGGGAASVTVTAAGINLDQFDTVYYILPIGGATTMVPANFRIVQYTSAFTVPPTWIPIAVRNSDAVAMGYGGPETVQWANGISMTPWVTPALLNSWTHYAAPYGPGRYRKYNGAVIGNGILSLGTVGASSVMFNLPAGWKPVSEQILTAATTAPGTGAGVEIRIDQAGAVIAYTGTAGYISLANINFIPEG